MKKLPSLWYIKLSENEETNKKLEFILHYLKYKNISTKYDTGTFIVGNDYSKRYCNFIKVPEEVPKITKIHLRDILKI